MQYFHMLL